MLNEGYLLLVGIERKRYDRTFSKIKVLILILKRCMDTLSFSSVSIMALRNLLHGLRKVL